MQRRPSFEIIPSNPIEALEYYEGYLMDLLTSHPKETIYQAFTIELIQNARLNIRSLKKRIKAVQQFKIEEMMR